MCIYASLTIISAVLGTYSVSIHAFQVIQKVKLFPRPFVKTLIGENGAVDRFSSSLSACSKASSALFMTPVLDDNEQMSQNVNPVDPIADVVRHAKTMDIDGIINTAFVIGATAFALTKFATVVDYQMLRGWTPTEIAYRVSLDNWEGYTTFLSRAPVETKALTSATVYTIGDFIAQRTEGKDIGEIDRLRILRSMLAGLIGHGPMSHVWYNFSENVFTNVLHWTEWWSFFPKVVLDQTTWGPLWNNSYIILLGLMKRDSLVSIWHEMKRTTVPLIISGLKLWPLAHCITYGVIPVENRLLWVDLVEIIWVTILASQANAAIDNPVDEPAIVPDDAAAVESKS